jgi:CheY-like chemotaxis protein
MSYFARISDPEKKGILEQVYKRSCQLLDNNTKFKYLTLHGTEHLSSLLDIADIILDSGLSLNQRQLFYLGMAICLHDLGMTIPLKDDEYSSISGGLTGLADPSKIEEFIRETHHRRISDYITFDSNYLSSLGLSPMELHDINEIGKAHRRIPLKSLKGDIQSVSALLRLIDELDVGSRRAPHSLLMTFADEMDSISKWHWFKHNITEEWFLGDNVEFGTRNNQKFIDFKISVRPPRKESIDYWLTQVSRPIVKTLKDQECHSIIKNAFGVSIELIKDFDRCGEFKLNDKWEQLEIEVLTSNKKVVLSIDDEAKKMEDLFFELDEEYHVKTVPYVKTAFQYLDSIKVDLVIVDLQMPAGGYWTAEETCDYKHTGLKFAEAVRVKHPNTKILILTGTKYSIPTDNKPFDELLKKPLDPLTLRKNVDRILS